MRWPLILAAAALVATGLASPGAAAVDRPDACKAASGMGTIDQWRSGVVIDPVSKSPIAIGTTDIDWTANPQSNPSWLIQLHGLVWVRGLIENYRKTGNERSLEIALAVMRDHINDTAANPAIAREAWRPHPAALRLSTYACLAHALQGKMEFPVDLDAQLQRHVAWHLTPSNYRTNHNHGLMQNLAVMHVGCARGRLDWIDSAWGRVRSEIAAVVDEQGANNEQSAWYALYNTRKWNTAVDAVTGCADGLAMAETVTQIRDALGRLLAFNQQSTQPDGLLAPIGDTYADLRGVLTMPGQNLTTVYNAGWAFGRSAWDDPNALYWTARYGPSRIKHGHFDHLSVTHYVDGGRALVDSGHAGFDAGALRTRLLSAAAHNSPAVVGQTPDAKSVATLSNPVITPTRTTLTLTDKAYGVTRTRFLLADSPSKVLVTRDTVERGSVRVPWHVAPGLGAEVPGPGTTVLTGRPTVTIVQFDALTCTPIGQQFTEVDIATGWRSLARSIRIDTVGKDVVSVIAPGRATVSCVPGTATAATVTVTGSAGSMAFTVNGRGLS